MIHSYLIVKKQGIEHRPKRECKTLSTC